MAIRLAVTLFVLPISPPSLACELLLLEVRLESWTLMSSSVALPKPELLLSPINSPLYRESPVMVAEVIRISEMLMLPDALAARIPTDSSVEELCAAIRREERTVLQGHPGPAARERKG